MGIIGCSKEYPELVKYNQMQTFEFQDKKVKVNGFQFHPSRQNPYFIEIHFERELRKGLSTTDRVFYAGDDKKLIPEIFKIHAGDSINFDNLGYIREIVPR